MRSQNWRKIRTKYCVLKLLLNGAKSESEIFGLIKFQNEFNRTTNQFANVEINLLIKASVEDLVTENKIKRREIYNTTTNIKRVEWFLNPKWLSETRLFKHEILRLKNLKDEADVKKINEEELKRKEKELIEQNKEKQRIKEQKATTEDNRFFEIFKTCLFWIIILITPILLYYACGGSPAEDIIHRRNFEKSR